jgi:hypothetical protein
MTLSDDQVRDLMQRVAGDVSTTFTADDVMRGDHVVATRSRGRTASPLLGVAAAVIAIIAVAGIALLVGRDGGPEPDDRPLAQRLGSVGEPPAESFEQPWWTSPVELSPATRVTLDGEPQADDRSVFAVGTVSDVVPITGTVWRDEPMIEGQAGTWVLTLPFNDPEADRAVVGVLLSVTDGLAGGDSVLPNEMTVELSLPSPTDVDSLRDELVGMPLAGLFWRLPEVAYPDDIWQAHPALYSAGEWLGRVEGDMIVGLWPGAGFDLQPTPIAEMLAGAGDITLETIDGTPTVVEPEPAPDPAAGETADDETAAPDVEAAPVVLRPTISSEVCRDGVADGDARRASPIDGPLQPFAIAQASPFPIQIVGEVDDPAQPFAVLLRYTSASQRWPTGVRVFDSGNGEGSWILQDGTWAYVRSRGMTEDELVALTRRMTPRALSHPVPGFDLSAGSGPQVLHEHLNTGLRAASAVFTCTVSTGGGDVPYSVLVAGFGEPVLAYLAVIDRSPPLAVRRNGDGVLLISGPDLPEAPTLDDVVDADQATWDSLLD